ncbi:inorganic diphosphatase [Ruegeria sp.]|uniref:inorganic diphosphatase n=1 Tax=Ruegeria sp. TaxID=1879320 RepID=UPI003B5B05B9
MKIEAFIENEAGSLMNHKYDEQTGTFLGASALAQAYPQNYGFLPGTLGEDGDCVDCFVISDRPLARGQKFLCDLIGLLEMWENGETDHKIILGHTCDPACVTPEVERIRAFETDVFGTQTGKVVELGAFLSPDHARRYLDAHRVSAA